MEQREIIPDALNLRIGELMGRSWRNGQYNSLDGELAFHTLPKALAVPGRQELAEQKLREPTTAGDEPRSQEGYYVAGSTDNCRVAALGGHEYPIPDFHGPAG